MPTTPLRAISGTSTPSPCPPLVVGRSVPSESRNPDSGMGAGESGRNALRCVSPGVSASKLSSLRFQRRSAALSMPSAWGSASVSRRASASSVAASSIWSASRRRAGAREVSRREEGALEGGRVDTRKPSRYDTTPCAFAASGSHRAGSLAVRRQRSPRRRRASGPCAFIFTEPSQSRSRTSPSATAGTRPWTGLVPGAQGRDPRFLGPNGAGKTTTMRI
jgi:hypothetical protein